ncbi:hypothetical protein WN944_013497 [Citrus x changshan-huyou]|uniref:Uncharacterized protein n=1 Tax=Citrus x changshan-huyou TaxID=2935761 RepID=A0AAP0M6P8_9ROSI
MARETAMLASLCVLENWEEKRGEYLLRLCGTTDVIKSQRQSSFQCYGDSIVGLDYVATVVPCHSYNQSLDLLGSTVALFIQVDPMTGCNCGTHERTDNLFMQVPGNGEDEQSRQDNGPQRWKSLGKRNSRQVVILITREHRMPGELPGLYEAKMKGWSCLFNTAVGLRTLSNPILCRDLGMHCNL